MINRVRYTRVGVPVGNSDSVGFAALEDGDTIVADFGARGQKFVSLTPTTPTVSVTSGNVTLTKADNGKTVVFDSTTARVVTLPAAKDCKGCRFKFYAKQLAGSSNHAISPAATDGIGGGVTALTSVANKDVLHNTTGDAVGDFIEIVSTGVAGTGAWVVVDAFGPYLKES